jgi:hypothetical protein
MRLRAVDKMNTAYGIFNPNLLGLDVNTNIPDRFKPYFDGEFKDDLPKIQEYYNTLSIYDRIDFMYLSTAVTHEIKHFHDVIGTTYWYHYYCEKLAIEMQLCTIIKKLTEVGRIRIPLNKWIQEKNCPQELKSFFKSYGLHFIHEDAMFHSDPIPGDYKQKPGLIIPMEYPQESNEKKLPGFVANLGYDSFAQLGYDHIYYPINAITLLEGAAFNLQWLQVIDLFGKDAWQLFLDSNKRYFFRGEGWQYSLSTTLIASALTKIEKFPSENILYAIHNYIFMGDFKRDQEAPKLNNDPGYRFSALLNHIMYELKKTNMTEEDVAELIKNYAIDFIGDRPYSEILDQELDDVDKLLIIMGFDSGHNRLQIIYSSTVQHHAIIRLSVLYRKMLRCRINNPELFYDPWEYLIHCTKLLPFPPNYSEISPDGNLVYGNIFEPVKVDRPEDIIALDEHKFWSLYYSISTILEAIIKTGKLYCPFVRTGKGCPYLNDKCKRNRIADNEDNVCIFTSAIHALGLECDSMYVRACNIIL